ncbi:MAG: two-component regulator propeller domain-containing protein [Longimicrobiales bacterium]
MVRPRAVVLLALLASAFPALACAQRLAIHTYTTADGLGNNVIHRIVRDSRGFLWFCTREGLSRFDGYGFTTYGIEHGLPSAVINDLLETRAGVYWVATRSGLVRFDPAGMPGVAAATDGKTNGAMFTTFTAGNGGRSAYVMSLLEDRSGVVWVGTWGGLYRIDDSDGGEVRLVRVHLVEADNLEAQAVGALMEDASGAIWIGTGGGIFRHLPGGRVKRYAITDSLPGRTNVHSLVADRESRIWVGTLTGGLARISLDPVSHQPVGVRVYTSEDGLPTRRINRIFQAADGELWAGSNAGLLHLLPTADGSDYRVRVYDDQHGLPYHEVLDVAEDRNGNLWVATSSGGASRILAGGFTTFDAGDGLMRWPNTLLETRTGDLLVAGWASSSGWSVSRFTGDSFVSVEIPALRGLGTWGWNQTMIVDRVGDWWIASSAGLFRFSGVRTLEELARATPRAVYTRAHGLAADVVLRLFEDSRGDVWISTVGNGVRPSGLSRWRRDTGSFQHYHERDGLPSFDTCYVSSFAEDRGGNVWIGCSGDAGLARYRGGRFERFGFDGDMPTGAMWNLLVDSRGRLWAASYHGGLGRSDDPEAETPTFSRYTMVQGLSSNEVHAVVEDRFGYIYAGTASGIDQLDPETGRVRRYASSAGLPVGEINAALRDRHGALWFSSSSGLVRLLPRRTASPPPPPAYITGVRTGGRSLPISAVGESEVERLELPVRQNQVQIEFVAPGSGPGEELRYQVRLDGADQDWSEPSGERSIYYASLSPGAYRFLVRAVNADGLHGEAAASFGFTILPPLWQRWWVLGLAALATAAAVAGLYRYRVARLLEVVNLRTRIATDLHDDIGANLTRIAILSEVARQQSASNGAHLDRRLTSIAELARESVSGLSEIVWALNPERESLRDLARKMREHAEDVYTQRDVSLSFHAPDDDGDRRLAVGLRRDLFLIFKEAVNNSARHSGCSTAHVRLDVDGPSLALEVQDDGCGFDPRAMSDGNGLLSMRRRAERLGAILDVTSRPGEGTAVRLHLPLDVKPHRRRDAVARASPSRPHPHE